MKPATTDDVLDLMSAHINAAALGAAMELGFFPCFFPILILWAYLPAKYF